MKHILKIAFAFTVLAIVTFVIWSINKPVKSTVTPEHKDSIEYAVYASQPTDYPEDCDPVYIPMDMLGAYQPGDRALVDSNGMIAEVVGIRSADSSQPIPVLHEVLIQERLDYNRWFPANK